MREKLRLTGILIFLICSLCLRCMLVRRLMFETASEAGYGCFTVEALPVRATDRVILKTKRKVGSY